MKRIECLVLAVGLVLIIFIYSLFGGVSISMTIGTLLIVLFFLILSSIILAIYKKQNRLKRIKNEIYIFSLCYINDEVNFSKFMNIIKKDHDFQISDIDSNKFIELLLENNLLVKLKLDMDTEILIEKINSLLSTYKINLNISLCDLTKNDTESIKRRRIKYKDTFIYDLNKITKKLRKSGYELVQLYPIDMNPHRINYYFMVLPIKSLLDLNEIGYMG